MRLGLETKWIRSESQLYACVITLNMVSTSKIISINLKWLFTINAIKTKVLLTGKRAR